MRSFTDVLSGVLSGAGLALALCTAGPALATIHIAGDSTAANYAAERYPQTGWGMMLPCALEGENVRNHAVGGRSTRTFITEGRLDRMAAELQPGDTVLIQFGHNDASADRPERFVSPEQYKTNLQRMIDMARGAKAQPVLLTPVTRRSFRDGKAKADFAVYSMAARELAEEAGVPLIDLEAASGQWLESVGQEESRPYFLHYTPEDQMPAFPQGIADDTHFSELGARAIADIVARELKALNLPVSAKVLEQRPDLTREAPLGRFACN